MSKFNLFLFSIIFGVILMLMHCDARRISSSSSWKQSDPGCTRGRWGAGCWNDEEQPILRKARNSRIQNDPGCIRSTKWGLPCYDEEQN